MGKNSGIQWTNHTFNPWMGCQKVSPGCDHCYAEGWAKRSGLVEWGPHATRRLTTVEYWRQPRRWAAAALKMGVRQRVFCASLADVWDNQVPPTWRRDLFHLIWDTRDALDWLLLTKRPENIERMLLPAIGEAELWPWPNVWLGITAEDQEHYNRRWPVLRAILAKKHFISYEPALGPIDLSAVNKPDPDWIIYGGESGHGARDPNGDRGIGYAYFMQGQCENLGIPFFMKQTVGKSTIPADLMIRQFPQ